VIVGITTTVRVFGHDLNSKTALPYPLTSLAIAWLILGLSTESQRSADARVIRCRSTS
jgi:hypothetical protein